MESLKLDFEQLNSTLDSIMEPLKKPMPMTFIRILIILYGSLAAPSLPLSVSKWFSNTYVRILLFAAIVYVAIDDPITSLLIAVVYFITINYATRKAIAEVTTSASVSPDVKIVVTSAYGPSIKPDTVARAEGDAMQSSVTEGKFNPPVAILSESSGGLQMVDLPEQATQEYNMPSPQQALDEANDYPAAYDSEPHATLTPMPGASVSASSSPQLSTIPATASVSDAMLTDSNGSSVPLAYESDVQASLAQVA